MAFVEDQIIGRLRGDARHPVRRLDRWLIAIHVDEGLMTADAIVGSRRFQLGRHGKDDRLLLAVARDGPHQRLM